MFEKNLRELKNNFKNFSTFGWVSCQSPQVVSQSILSERRGNAVCRNDFGHLKTKKYRIETWSIRIRIKILNAIRCVKQLFSISFWKSCLNSLATLLLLQTLYNETAKQNFKWFVNLFFIIFNCELKSLKRLKPDRCRWGRKRIGPDLNKLKTNQRFSSSAERGATDQECKSKNNL